MAKQNYVYFLKNAGKKTCDLYRVKKYNTKALPFGSR